jgi:signal peptidase I
MPGDRDRATDDRGLGERAADWLASGLGLATTSEKDFIKRIIGLPGETVEMREGVVYVDGEPIPELTSTEGGYLSAPDMFDFQPVTVPPDSYFMMGDNRPNSADSRSTLGTIERDDIVGRAFVIIWPVTRVDTLPIADYPETTASDQPADGRCDVAA